MRAWAAFSSYRLAANSGLIASAASSACASVIAPRGSLFSAADKFVTNKARHTATYAHFARVERISMKSSSASAKRHMRVSHNKQRVLKD